MIEGPEEMYHPDSRANHVPQSQSIPPAPVTGPDPALITLKNVGWQCMTTLFALVAAMNIPPSAVVAVVAVPKILHLGSYLLDWRRPRGMGLSSDDLCCSGEETIFVPLRTAASLPLLAADVAKLGTASASIVVS